MRVDELLLDDLRLVGEKLLDHGFDYFSSYSAIEINSTFEYFSTYTYE